MGTKKIANLDTEILYEMGDTMKVQKVQLDTAERLKNDIEDGMNRLEKIDSETRGLAEEAEKLLTEFMSMQENCSKEFDIGEMLNQPIENEVNLKPFSIKKAETIRTCNKWEQYMKNISEYALGYDIDTTYDPFSTLLSQREYEDLKREINDEFAKKTSIKNKIDLKFLAIATALQVTKTLLFPIIADKIGYGQNFDETSRLSHNDKSIKQEERKTRDKYKESYSKKNETGEWTKFLYQAPPYDTTVGSPNIGFNMGGGKYHRLNTLGHDPILGWFFGTANILTDTITLRTFATYKVERDPVMRIIPEIVLFPSLFIMTMSKIKEHKLNFPAALVAEKIHLKSDEFTKCGLPVPIVQTFAPDFAGKLYKNQYDFLCFSRDLKIVGSSAAISVLIDMIIGLTHALYYDKDKDGTKDMFEVRTRKILLISNTIASTSNIIYSVVTGNPQALDIGGLLITVMHLFSDTQFILDVKKEFIENRIYEKIEEEIELIDKNQTQLMDFEYKFMLNQKHF